MEFCEYSYDFHTIREENGVVYHDFDFMNTGEKSLYIKRVIPSCGCMASEWSKEPVEPGGKSTIRLGYNPMGRQESDFLGMAEVYTNCGVINLKIQGRVERADKGLPADYILKPGVVHSRVMERKDHFALILDRMRKEMLNSKAISRNDSLVEHWVGKLRRGGKWTDLDYTCFFRTNWEQIRHLDRVYMLSLAYVSPKSRYHGNDTLFLAIQDALSFWVECKPESHNWWYNQIAVPQRLGDILVLLDAGVKPLPVNLQQQLFLLMAWLDPRKWTGANKQDIAVHHLQRGCLMKDDSIVRFASGQIFYPVRFTNQEGLQADYSYQQHGNQLYIGGYGEVFVHNVVKVAGWLQGTSYALKDEQLEIFSRFVRETYLNVFRGPYIDFSVLGRGISREGAVYHGNIPDLLEKMQGLDSLYATEYGKLKARFQGHSDSARYPFSQVFWRSDYALHNRKGFDFSVRTSSVRTVKIESGNGENLKGRLLSGGATCLRRMGDEYYNIFPLWNWNRIPGVTAYEENENLVAAPWGERGKNVFSGGVSDGEYSMMAYQTNDFDIKACKSWFMFDQEIVCLGAGIGGERGGKISTTVEQCHYQSLEVEGNKVLHNQILYYFPEGTNFKYEVKTATGAWNDINYNYSLRPVKGETFSLWIDHGDYPQEGKYVYLMVPGVGSIPAYDTTQVVVVRNDTLVQAVYQKELDVLQLVCYAPASLEMGKVHLRADQPCTVMVRGAYTENPSVYVADPCLDKKEINIYFKNAVCELENKVLLPMNEEKGSTIKMK